MELRGVEPRLICTPYSFAGVWTLLGHRTALRFLSLSMGPWRKLKGIAHVRLPNGNVRLVELHWYEAHGIGRKNIKIKRYVG